jgi:hypothetical protein
MKSKRPSALSIISTVLMFIFTIFATFRAVDASEKLSQARAKGYIIDQYYGLPNNDIEISQRELYTSIALAIILLIISCRFFNKYIINQKNKP